MHLLCFWRGDNYRRDVDLGVGFHLNQGNPLLHEIQTGERLWAFTRRTHGRYALAAKLVSMAQRYPEEWLLVECQQGEKAPTKYWLSTLPVDAELEALVDGPCRPAFRDRRS